MQVSAYNNVDTFLMDRKCMQHNIGHHLVFIGKFPATRGVWVIIG